jgi:hypothetical protein
VRCELVAAAPAGCHRTEGIHRRRAAHAPAHNGTAKAGKAQH